MRSRPRAMASFSPTGGGAAASLEGHVQLGHVDPVLADEAQGGRALVDRGGEVLRARSEVRATAGVAGVDGGRRAGLEPLWAVRGLAEQAGADDLSVDL